MSDRRRDKVLRGEAREQRVLKSRAAVGRWNSEHTDGPWVLKARAGKEKYRLTVERVGLKRMVDGTMHVDCIAWLDERAKGGEWTRVPADPDGHYTFGGPPEQLEDEIWDAVLTTASPEAQASIEDARAKGFPSSSTTVFYDEKVGGGLYCYSNLSYSNSGDNLGAENAWYYTDTGAVGQDKSSASHWERYRAYHSFDTAGLLDTCTVTATTYSAKSALDATTTDFNIRVFAYDWGATLTVADWCNEDTLPADAAHLATYATSGGFVSGTYYDWTNNGVNLINAVNKTADTRVILVSDRDRAKTEPTTGVTENVWIWGGTTCRDTDRPKLTVTYSVAGVGPGTGTGDAIDYTMKVVWSTFRWSTGAGTPFPRAYICEEGITATDRGKTEAYYTPLAGCACDFNFARIPANPAAYYLPAGDYTICVPYFLALDAALTIECDLLVDSSSATTGSTTVVLPATGADSTYGVTVTVPVAKVVAATLSFRVTITSTSGTAKVYWLPTDANCVNLHWGLKASGQSNGWDRMAPVIIMESPPASSHDAPIPLAGRPVVKFLAEGIYPTDKVTLTKYSDRLATEEHDPRSAKVQFTNVLVSTVSRGIMAPGSNRRYIEIGEGSNVIDPPAGATDVAPGVAKWTASTAYAEGALVIPTFNWTRYYRCTVDGTSGATEPWWPLTPDALTTPSTVVDGGATWVDAGDRYQWKANTYYEMVIASSDGTMMVTSVPLHTVLDVKTTPGSLDAGVPAPVVGPLDDTTSAVEVTVTIAGMESSPYYLEVELTDPSGNAKYYRPGAQLKQNLGRLEGA